MAAHLLLILAAATLWGQPPRGEIAPFGFTPDGAARYWATPASTAWVWLGEWRPVPLTGIEARVSNEGVLTLVDVEALRARAAALEAQVSDLRREVELLKLAPAGPAGPASTCVPLRMTSARTLQADNCAGERISIDVAGCDRDGYLVAWNTADGIRWGISACGDRRALPSITPPLMSEYLGAARLRSPCLYWQPLADRSKCAVEIAEVRSAERPTAVFPVWSIR